MKKLLLLLTLLLWLPIAQATKAELQRGLDAYKSGDFRNAIAILKPLAKRGHAEAQYILGGIYYEGPVGVRKDNVLAYMWLSLAIKDGLTQQMSDANIAGAQDLVRRCMRSNYEDCP